MAHVMLARHTRREWFFTDRPVGQGLQNLREDVLLVQFLLKVASQTAGGFAGFVTPGEPSLVIDGNYGPQTQKYISYYQIEVNRRVGEKILQPDGRIDPPPRGGWTSAITNTRYTIIDLNSAYRARRGDTFRIETDPFFPNGLRTCFFMGS